MIRRLALALLAAALLLTGCSGSPGEEEPTAAATAAPMDAPPTMPELALDDSPTGAEAFVRHYIDVLNYAALTGDISTLEDLSSPDCSGCSSYIELFHQVYANGGRMTGGEWKVANMRRLDEAATTLVVDISAAAGASKSDEDASEERHAAYDDTLVFSLQRSGATWLVSGLDRAVEQ